MLRIRLMALMGMLLALVLVVPVRAQTPSPAGDLTQSYITDGGWSFNYPEGWIINPTGNTMTLANSAVALKHGLSNLASDDVVIIIGAGSSLQNGTTDLTTPNMSASDALLNVLQAQGIKDGGNYSVSAISSLPVRSLDAAGVTILVRRQQIRVAMMIVRYARDFWCLFTGAAVSEQLADQNVLTMFNIATSLDINGRGGVNTFTIISPKATFQYPDGWYVQAAGSDGAYMATTQDLLFRTTNVNYEVGDERITIRINTTKALIAMTGAMLEGDSSPLKFLQAEIKKAQGTTDTNLANATQIDSTLIEGKPGASVTIHDSTNSYAEEIWYIEYAPGVMVRLVLTTALDGLSQGETDALSVIQSIHYDDSAS